MGNCDRCYKKVDEVFEVNDEYICIDCLDDRNNQIELMGDLYLEC